MTKTKKLVAGLLGAAAMLAIPTVGMAQARSADMGWYAGVTIGQSDLDGVDETDTAFRVLGGYQINRMFAAELGYSMLFDKGGAEVTAIELVGVGSWPLANQFSVYGKLGMYRGEVEFTGGGSDSNTDLTYGIGLRYDFARNLGARLEWQSYTGDDNSDISVLSVGVVYKF
jgi:opacity protein-like surface antigen